MHARAASEAACQSVVLGIYRGIHGMQWQGEKPKADLMLAVRCDYWGFVEVDSA